IAIFYMLGEWWRRKLIDTKSKDASWLVLAILIAGLVIFLIGSFYLFSPPTIPINLTLAGFGLVSAFVGFAASYLFLRVRRKSEDQFL
ncbi:MAG: hypothetical protein ACREBS_01475, partial [Nitrososphaerales archaeon]